MLLASVSARVNKPHMMALKSRFSPKKAARRAYSKNLLDGSRPNVEASEEDHVVVSSVVVLGGLVSSLDILGGEGAGAQLCEDAVEGGACAGCDGEEEPG